MNINERICALRVLMKENGIDAYIIPSSDPHMSEYVADRWTARSWISGFTGSAGTVVITHQKSGLWTDGRYFIQGENQLKDTEIELFRMGQSQVPTYIEWLEGELKKESVVGLFGELFPVTSVKEMQKSFDKKGIVIKTEFDLVDLLWRDRPAIPQKSIFVHSLEYTGLTAKEKVNKVREEMKKQKISHYLVSALDSIAWLYNIRGNDVVYNPVAYAYAIVSDTKSYLFIDSAKVNQETEAYLKDNDITIKDYTKIHKVLSKLSKGDLVGFDHNKTNYWLYKSIGKDVKKVKINDIITNEKSVKNETEIRNLMNAQVKDGVAMVEFLYWLDTNINEMEITELTVAERLEYFRQQQDKNMGLSFNTIAGYKGNAAMMHYAATEKSHSKLEKHGLILIDSGGQYLDGTTDITRTIVLGELTDEERFDFTMVVKGHIGLARARFLYGAVGANLDVLARQPLWEAGLDYKCGTGHGVGYFLNVHEGPCGFSQRLTDVKLKKGMTITNEPGVYKQGKHGIRIENTLLVEEGQKTDSGQFMCFKTISYCPIDLRGIKVELLTETERCWLNEYHFEVFEKLSPYLDHSKNEWLSNATREI